MQTFSEWVQEIDPQLAEVLGSILSASGAFEEKGQKRSFYARGVHEGEITTR